MLESISEIDNEPLSTSDFDDFDDDFDEDLEEDEDEDDDYYSWEDENEDEDEDDEIFDDTLDSDWIVPEENVVVKPVDVSTWTDEQWNEHYSK